MITSHENQELSSEPPNRVESMIYDLIQDGRSWQWSKESPCIVRGSNWLVTIVPLLLRTQIQFAWSRARQVVRC